jgi:ABC-2 type transport system permease protein
MIALVGLIKKELKVAFTTPVAYVVFFLFTLLASLMFSNQLREYERMVQKSRHIEDPEVLAQLNFNDVILSEMFVNVQIIFIFLIPILTMRAFAEEKKQRTMELLMTTPITPITVIVGKYIATFIVLVCLAALLFTYPVILTAYGTISLVGESVIDWPTTILGISGVLLCGSMFAAAGFAFSALTENQVVAALLTFFLLLLLWFLGGAANNVHGWLGQVLGFASPLSHINSFARGLFNLGDALYYVSFTAVFLLVTYRMVEGERWG